MSYDIYLRDPITGEVVTEKDPTGIYGTTYCVENCDLWINLTFNYRDHFIEAFGPDGIHTLHGMVSKETWDMLQDGIGRLWPDKRISTAPINTEDPWTPYTGDAIIALRKLLNLALRAPNAIWDIES